MNHLRERSAVAILSHDSGTQIVGVDEDSFRATLRFGRRGPPARRKLGQMELGVGVGDPVEETLVGSEGGAWKDKRTDPPELGEATFRIAYFPKIDLKS